MSTERACIATHRGRLGSSPGRALEFLLSEAARFRKLGADPERIRRRIQQLLADMNLSASGVVVEGVTEMVCGEEIG